MPCIAMTDVVPGDLPSPSAPGEAGSEVATPAAAHGLEGLDSDDDDFEYEEVHISRCGVGVCCARAHDAGRHNCMPTCMPTQPLPASATALACTQAMNPLIRALHGLVELAISTLAAPQQMHVTSVRCLHPL